jgi:competence protein ComFC
LEKDIGMTGNTINPVFYNCYRIFWMMLDWLYPPACAGCGAAGQRWCTNCQTNTLDIGMKVCEQCGEPNHTGRCLYCRHSPPAYTAVRSWAVYGGPVRHALHQLKYRQNLALGDSLSVHLIQLYKKLNWPVDFIVPVPLSRKRKRTRGYNQAALLARPLSLATGIEYRPNALGRIRETVSQVGLSGQERLKNVSGAFTARPELVQGKKIMVIDDITTTGATIQHCATALLSAGAVEVYGLTVARAILETHNDSGIDNSTTL